MEMRLCDLELTVEESWLVKPIRTVLRELERKDLHLKPHFWLSDDWFCPDGVPGVAIPFYLAHPRLVRLERSEMLTVEGGSYRECVKILRHEIGHAMDHAYNLNRKKKWRQLFGPSSRKYPDYYRPNPASKRYVQHLDYWYAQAHPDEDFAETFAVWLAPRSQWRKRYRSWPAIKKLRYVDELMTGLQGVKPKVRSRRKIDPLRTLKQTIGEYYEEKKERYGTSYPDVYDRELKMVFSDDPKHKRSETAAAFLRRNRSHIRRMVARWTGEYEFTLDQVFNEMIGRCKELKLRAVGTDRQLRLDFTILLTVKTMHHLYTQHHWLPL